MSEKSKKSLYSPLFLAISLLTRIPVPEGISDEKDWGRSTAAFPFCGFILGIVSLLPYFLLSFHGTNSHISLVGAVSYIIILAWMTRMFHLDGFCDACDAFSAMNATPESRLKLMKDPHPGAAAICGTILLLIAKVAVIYILLETFIPIPDGRQRILVILACLAVIPAIARFAMLILAAVSSYPRESGTGAIIVGKVPKTALLIAAITLIPFLVFISWKQFAAIFILNAMLIFYWKIKADQLLGGVTGDILGACCETSEVAVALGLVLPAMLLP